MTPALQRLMPRPGPWMDRLRQFLAFPMYASAVWMIWVLTQQTARLYEAMCAQRTWTAADWREFLLEHPLVGQLVSRLVWLENPGPGQRAFRPTEDGSLIDADDDTIELEPDARHDRVSRRDHLEAPQRAAAAGHRHRYARAPTRPTLLGRTVNSFNSLASEPIRRRNGPVRPGLPQSGAGGCTWRPGPTGRAPRS